MSLRWHTPCDDRDLDGNFYCPYMDSDGEVDCEYWCGADEPDDDPEEWYEEVEEW